MKTSHAVLIASAVGATGIWTTQRQHRQHRDLWCADMHQRLLADLTSDPEMLENWRLDGMSAEEAKRMVSCNRQMALLSIKFRMGLLDRTRLRVQARALLERESFRAYWGRFASFREDEAMDRRDHAFNAVIDDEYAAVSPLEAAAS
ncbi:DUF6082 family protein [Streptomyces sp. NPDC056296]|uniref:DUF6082 family protein n=1 Tax=Streptomyces sp. NPDC056296 TaxID=3345775 RepID=UPI0035DC32C2